MLLPSRQFILRSYTARNGKSYYDEWLGTLGGNIRLNVLKNVKKLILGLGDQKNLDSKLWELRIDFGQGYRVYFYRDGLEIILLLAGSDKRDQERTIKLARSLIKEIEEDKKKGIHYAERTS
jgi:putative addiction module killer protein